MNAGRWICIWVVLLLVGCGATSTKSTRVKEPSPAEQVKATLQRYAETGQTDSEIVSLQEQLEAMKKTDEAKANALLSDFETLKSASSPAKVKEQANAMLGKL